MIVWAISDLHLSNARPDRRERFAERWRDHADRIAAAWREAVGSDDVVLVPGDVSMALNHRDLQPDLRWLEALPGSKVLAPGNHDRWWNDVARIRPMLRPSLHAIDGDAIELGGIIVAGARSIPTPRDDDPRPRATIDAEVQVALGRVDSALEAADRLRAGGARPVYFLWHFPPFDAVGRPGAWVERFEASGVTDCVYGHLHTQAQWSRAVQGLRGGVRYRCVAADAIGFRPLRVGIIN